MSEFSSCGIVLALQPSDIFEIFLNRQRLQLAASNCGDHHLHARELGEFTQCATGLIAENVDVIYE